MNTHIKHELNQEIARITEKYHDINTIQDLENIAREEYQITQIVQTPLVVAASVAPKKDNTYIIFLPRGTIEQSNKELAKKIGALFSGMYHSIKFTQEDYDEIPEYFASQLLKTSSRKKPLFNTVSEISQKIKNTFSTIDDYKETTKLKNENVYNLFLLYGIRY